MLVASQNMLGRPSPLVVRQPMPSCRPAHAFRPVALTPLAPRKQLAIVCAAAAEAPPAAEAPVVAARKKMGVARSRFSRGSPSKVRRILDVIRGKSYEDALVMCEYMPYAACEPIAKVLMAAAANAKSNTGALKSKLVVTECMADDGPIMRRVYRHAKGQMTGMIKRLFHLTIKVEERD